MTLRIVRPWRLPDVGGDVGALCRLEAGYCELFKCEILRSIRPEKLSRFVTAL